MITKNLTFCQVIDKIKRILIKTTKTNRKTNKLFEKNENEAFNLQLKG